MSCTAARGQPVSTNAIYTVGHSNRSLDDLADLLRSERIHTLVDVRARPGSRHNPQFAAKALRVRIEQACLTYQWAGDELGGLRRCHQDSPHVGLPEARRGYADHMCTNTFHNAVAEVVTQSEDLRFALMCAERLPQHCHRSMIADYLTLKGIQVIHLIDPEVSHSHNLNPALRYHAGNLIYDRNSQGTLNL